MDQYFSISLIVFISLITLIYITTYNNPTVKIMDRPIWYNPRNLLDYNLDAPGTSKQIGDIYSLSHITHGILFYLLFKYLKININKGFLFAVVLEIIWEIFENSPYIINKYRKRPEYQNYSGDSIVNMLGDTLCMIFGFYMCYKNETLALIYMVTSEVMLSPYDANFIHLSFGSLLSQS